MNQVVYNLENIYIYKLVATKIETLNPNNITENRQN